MHTIIFVVIRVGILRHSSLLLENLKLELMFDLELWGLNICYY